MDTKQMMQFIAEYAYYLMVVVLLLAIPVFLWGRKKDKERALRNTRSGSRAAR